VLVTGHSGCKGSWLAVWLQTLGAHLAVLALPADTEPANCDMLRLKVDEALSGLRGAAALHTMPTATTDKCFVNRNDRETDTLGGYHLYSASKPCAEIVSASYRASFLKAVGSRVHAVGLATARVSNVIGGDGASADRLIPDLACATRADRVTPIRYSIATRPLHHMLKALSGNLLLGHLRLADPAMCAEAGNVEPDIVGHPSVQELVTSISAHRHRMWHGQRMIASRIDLYNYLADTYRAGLAWAQP